MEKKDYTENSLNQMQMEMEYLKLDNNYNVSPIELPEEIIEYILSFAPDYRDNLRECQRELLKNKPIYFWKEKYDVYEVEYGLEIFKPDIKRYEERFISGLGMEVIWLRALEISREKDEVRTITAYYGWAREKNHPWRRDNPRSTRGVNLKTGYY